MARLAGRVAVGDVELEPTILRLVAATAPTVISALWWSSWTSSLDTDPAGVVDTAQQRRIGPVREELVDGLAGARPVAVVVHN